MSEYRRILVEEFTDKEYREAYADDFLNTRIATQIRAIREQRGLTQEALAQKVGIKPEAVARLENVNYTSWNIRTLKKVAHALEGRLNVSIETYGSLVEEAGSFSREWLERSSFSEDPAFQDATFGGPVSEGIQNALSGRHGLLSQRAREESRPNNVHDFLAFKPRHPASRLGEQLPTLLNGTREHMQPRRASR